MIIVAGWLRVRAQERAAYLAAVAGVAPAARGRPGCLDFVQAADPLDGTRVNVYERWESDEALEAFRASATTGEGSVVVPEVVDAQVRRYRIASVEDP